MFDYLFVTVRPDRSTPAAFAALDVAVRAAAEDARSCAGWTAAERAAALRVLDVVAGALATARGALLIAEREAGTSLRVGDKDFVAARARSTRAGTAAVHREVRQAQALADLPLVAEAVGQGRVPVGHVDALARSLSVAGAEAAAALRSSDGQTELAELGARLPEREFAHRVAALVAAYDHDAAQAGFDGQHAARFLHLAPTGDGVVLKGRLDPVAGERLRVALDATGVAPDERRDASQARADALVAVAERSLVGRIGVGPRRRRSSPDETPVQAAERDAAHLAAQARADRAVSGVASRPHVVLLVPAETFAAVREHARSGPTLTGANASTVLPATLEDGTPVADSEVARVLCDAEVSRIALDAEGLPLDLGRTTRLYTAAHRRAVVVRDRACAWHGCTTRAAYCEVHHLRWWGRDRGSTSIENGVLLCSFHHHLVHRLDLTIERHAPGPPGEVRTRLGEAGRGGAVRCDEPPGYTFRRRTDGSVVCTSVATRAA